MAGILAAISLGLLATTGGAPQPLGVFDCETVDRGGYSNVVDPTCPAQYRERDEADEAE